MNERQEKYLAAAYKVVGDANNKQFDFRIVGQAAGFNQEEAKDIFIQLTKMGKMTGLLDGKGFLSPDGREDARNIAAKMSHVKTIVPEKPEASASVVKTAGGTATQTDDLRYSNPPAKPFDTLFEGPIESFQRVLRAVNVDPTVTALGELFQQIKGKLTHIAKFQYRSSHWKEQCQMAEQNGFRQSYTGEDCAGYIAQARLYSARSYFDECLNTAMDIAMLDGRIPQPPKGGQNAENDLREIQRWCIDAERTIQGTAQTPPAIQSAGPTYIVENLHQHGGHGDLNVNPQNINLGSTQNVTHGDDNTVGSQVAEAQTNAKDERGWFARHMLKIITGGIVTLAGGILLAWAKHKWFAS